MPVAVNKASLLREICVFSRTNDAIHTYEYQCAVGEFETLFILLFISLNFVKRKQINTQVEYESETAYLRTINCSERHSSYRLCMCG
jgi:hypothetical protein